MRKIQIEEGLRVRFPEMGTTFDDGVEIGVIASLMAASTPDFTRSISAANLNVTRLLAGKLGYRVTEVRSDTDDMVAVSLTNRPRRPSLRLVSSRG